MHVITAPQQIPAFSDVFLAGGISNCPDWQADAIQHLSQADGIVLNPRRQELIMNEGEQAKEQIAWEFNALRQVAAIIFWFPAETLCPITLFELGSAILRDVPLFIGTDPKYARRFDIKQQIKLNFPTECPTIYSSLPFLLEAYVQWVQTMKNYNYGHGIQ